VSFFFFFFFFTFDKLVIVMLFAIVRKAQCKKEKAETPSSQLVAGYLRITHHQHALKTHSR
jgi:hypothetical protein